jgi:hypothetical protein
VTAIAPFLPKYRMDNREIVSPGKGRSRRPGAAISALIPPENIAGAETR